MQIPDSRKLTLLPLVPSYNLNEVIGGKIGGKTILKQLELGKDHHP